MARNFRSVWKFLVPSWLNEGEGGLVGYALMLLNDASMERLYRGHLARFPQQGPDGTPAPDDALAAMGRDRGIVRGISETSASYAVRLTQWLVDARTRGTAYTMMKQLAAYVGAGSSFRIVDNRGNWYSRDADGAETAVLNQGNWDWDGDTDRWARFWVIVYPGSVWTEEPYTWGDADDPAWGADMASSGTHGSTALLEHGDTMRAIIADWKPGGTRCAGIIIAFDPASFDPATPEPDGTWGGWYTVDGGIAVPSRLETARYMNGS